jgi:Ran GTPase-activating protein (RanGAP) involved in mRNA processing and transport
MTRLQKMVDVLDSIENKFNLDVMDLRILSKAQTYWSEDRELRVTDLVRVFSIASPATMHYRISKDLVKVGMFKLRPNPNDMREKLVEKGRRYEELHNFVEGL